MSRRTLTQLLATVLAVGLTVVGFVAPVPYVSLEPGPTFNTLGDDHGRPVLAITGHTTRRTTGHLDLTTVGVRADLSLGEALLGWFSRTRAVVPRELVFAPNLTDQQQQQQNTHDMVASQNSATTAALGELGLYQAEVSVAQVSAGAPADGVLKPNDVLVSVDGHKINNRTELTRMITAHTIGDTVAIGYRRDGKAHIARLVTVAAHDDGPVRPVIGVLTREAGKKYLATVSISLTDVGGPSAGLMFALGIMDKLGTVELTGGRYIAGTGEITDAGNVNPIGGITQKLLGARGNGATVFLVPKDNCKEAAQNRPSGMQLIQVTSLHDALVQLRLLRDGGTPRPC